LHFKRVFAQRRELRRSAAGLPQELVEILVQLRNALESAHIWFGVCQREHALDTEGDVRVFLCGEH
jgi:hypothetical protein